MRTMRRDDWLKGEKMRKLMRSVARKKMEDEGIKHINKHSYSGAANGREVESSYFATEWRNTLEKEDNKKEEH